MIRLLARYLLVCLEFGSAALGALLLAAAAAAVTPAASPEPSQGRRIDSAAGVYAIEGNVAVSLAEWGGQRVQIMLEQGALFDGKGVRYLAGRQTDWHLIR